MKRNSKLIIALALVLVLSLSCLSLIGCSKKHVCESKCEVCGKCTDLECNEKACSDKCQGHNDPTPGPSGHVCAHKCETCGKCTDETCADSACSDKCQGHENEYISIPVTGEVRYDLGVIKGFASLSNVSVTKDNCEEGESCVTDFSWDKNSSVTMEIWSNAEEDVEGDLVIKVRRTVEVITLTSQISVEVNGDVLESDAQVPSSLAGETASFAEVNLGKFWLTPGKNVIIVKPQSNINNFDFSAVIFYSTEEANLQWYAMHEVEGTLFNGTDEHVAFDGDYKVNLAENCLGVGGYGHASATFPVYASREAKAKIYLVTNSMPADYLVTDYFNWTINDVKISSTAKMPYHTECWGNYAIVEVGEYVLDGGLNNIKLDVSDAVVATGAYVNYYNLRGIIIDTDAKIGFEEQTAEAHVCISVCPDCGGCLDADCTEDACATKCDCAHKCESVCDVCGGCLNAECSEEECSTKCSCVSKTIVAATQAVIEQGKVDNSGNLGCDTLDKNTYRTKFHYVINAEKAGKAELSIVISSTTGGIYKATDVYMTTINSQTYTSDAVSVNDGIPWSTYHTIYLGVIDLGEGENVIAFDHYHITDMATAAVSNWGESVNFQSIILNTPVSYTVTHDVCINKCATCGGCLEEDCDLSVCSTKCHCAHECEHVCIVCNGCKDADCSDKVCETKCACTSKTIVAATQAVIEQGKVDDSGNLGCDTLDKNTYRTKFHYVINAEKAGKAELSIVISSTTGGIYKATDVYMTTINSQTYTSDAVSVNDGIPWSTYHTIYLGVIDLVAGENVIAFDHYHITDMATAAVTNWGDSVNFQSIILNTNVNYTVEAPAAE